MPSVMDSKGPELLINKRRNGAEEFNAEHQAAYDARGKQSGDDVNKVNYHNETYPKMQDELNKRKSLIKIITSITANLSSDFCPTCTGCVKLLINELKRKNIIPKSCKASTSRPVVQYAKTYPRKQRGQGSRVTKSKSKKQRTSKNSTKSCNLSIWINKGSPCASSTSITNKRSGSNTKPQEENRDDTSKRPEDLRSKFAANVPMIKSLQDNYKKSSLSIDTELSNYSSYMSLDHEPMVDP